LRQADLLIGRRFVNLPHKILERCLRSVEQLYAVVLDHWIRQHLMRDRLQVFQRLLARQAIGDREFEELALTNVSDGRVTEAVKRGADRLALWI
jgi:hypothetical protein